jgi:hypothetical protein
MNISLYKNTFSEEFADVPMDSVKAAIINGTYAETIARLRTLTGKEYKAAKEKLPACTWSGTFTERFDKCINQYSRHLILDIDHLDPASVERLKAQMATDDYVQFAFLSPSGNGLKILVQVDTSFEYHLAAFLHLQKVFEEKYCFKVDNSGKNLSRICYMSYDPSPVVKEHWKVFEVDKRFGEVSKQYVMPANLQNYQASKDIKFIFETCVKWVERSFVYANGRNNYVHAMCCALNRGGVSMGDAEFLIKNNYGDLDEKELVHCVKSAYFHQAWEHGSVEIKNLGGVQEFQAPPYVANYTNDIVLNDIMAKTAMLYHHGVPINEINDIVAKVAKYYKNEGFIDINRATLLDIMGKSVQMLQQNVAMATDAHTLNWSTAEDMGMSILDSIASSLAIPTTFDIFDKPMRGGIMPGNFYGLIGVGGTWKSVFAQYISSLAACKNKPVLYLNGEMSPFQFYERLALMTLGVNLYDLVESKKLNPQTLPTFIAEINKVLHNNLIMFNGNGAGYTSILATIKNVEAKIGKRIELVIVDGLTQMDPLGKKEAEAAIHNTGVLKEVAKHAHDGAGVAVIGLMHVSGAPNSLQRDSGPVCRGGVKSVANMDGYFSTSLFLDPAVNSFDNIGSDLLYLKNKFHLRFTDKRSTAGIINAVINVNDKLHLSHEPVDPLQYEIKLNRK